MSAFGPKAVPGSWQWPEEIPRERVRRSDEPSTSNTQPGRDSNGPNPNQTQSNGRQQKQRHWKPRTCRICLETVLPTFHPPPENLPGIFQSSPNVTYESEEGRLIRPCKCKGTAKYVHEGCLQSWRHADPGYAKRNYWQCPTCGFRYHLMRLGWGRIISSIGKSSIQHDCVSLSNDC
jgi:hypothetical protein